MKIEHELKIIPVDENLAKATAELEAQGWKVLPGVKPMAIFPVVRISLDPTQAATMGGVGRLVIDDSKVDVMRPDPETGEMKKVG